MKRRTTLLCLALTAPLTYGCGEATSSGDDGGTANGDGTTNDGGTNGGEGCGDLEADTPAEIDTRFLFQVDYPGSWEQSDLNMTNVYVAFTSPASRFRQMNVTQSSELSDTPTDWGEGSDNFENAGTLQWEGQDVTYWASLDQDGNVTQYLLSLPEGDQFRGVTVMPNPAYLDDCPEVAAPVAERVLLTLRPNPDYSPQ